MMNTQTLPPSFCPHRTTDTQATRLTTLHILQMARTKQTACKSTRGEPPHKQLAAKSPARKSAIRRPHSTD
jgi:HD-like signal output (HDOD) protein